MDNSDLSIGILNWMRRAQKALDKEEIATAREALSRAAALIRETAPELWQVDVELGQMVRGQPAHCRLPKEFAAIPELAHAVGFPITMGCGGEPALGEGETIDIQLLREAMIKIGPKANPPVLYFGPYREAGHHLRFNADGGWARIENLQRAGFPVDRNHHDGLKLSRGLDPGYCPGYNPADNYHRTRPEVEGEAKLTHENGMTILAIWDRSVDKRGACHSTYIALGTYGFETMKELCKRAYEWRWNLLESRMPIVLVEKERIS